MIVTCDKCGKGYQIDPEQVEGETTSFRCDTCNHVITVSLRTTAPGDSSPRNPGNPDEPAYIDMAEEVVETLLSTPEMPQAVPPETGSGEFMPPNLGAPEHINLAEEGEARPISNSEISRGLPSENGSGVEEPPNPGAPEYINLAQEGEAAPISIAEISRRVPSETGSGELRSLNLGAPEYINLAHETVSAPLPQSKIGLRDKVFFFVPICLIIVAGVLLLIL